MEVNKSIFKRQADFLEKNGKYILQFTKEYIHHKKFDTIEEIKVGVFEYIEKWYNRERIQEKIGYLTPVEFEEMSKKII